MPAPDGPQAWMDYINMLEDRIDRNCPISGLNTTVDDSATGNGRVINASPPAAAASAKLQPLQIASAIDSAHPARIRVVNGRFNGILPDEMTVPDGVQTDGTDNTCYLTLSSGTNYVYAKVLVDGDTGLLTSANAYVSSSVEDPDGTYVYFLIGTVTQDSGTGALAINQDLLGEQLFAVLASADGTLLTAIAA